MRLHTGERPFLCEEPGCHKSFITLGHLNDHVLKHKTGRQFQCNICSKIYRNSVYLKKHLKDCQNNQRQLGEYDGKIKMDHHKNFNISSNNPVPKINLRLIDQDQAPVKF